MNVVFSSAVRSLARAGRLAVLLILTAQLAHAATITVLNENDTGGGSLRNAIEEANTTAGPDTIVFDAAVSRIVLDSQLPALNDATGGTTIDGGSAVTISGENLSLVTPGLSLSSDDNVVTGVRIVNFPGAGIRIDGNNCTVRGCRIGVEQGAAPNQLGIFITGTGTVIGGASPDDLNVIAGNVGEGVRISVPDNLLSDTVLRNNYIGTSPGGNTNIGNGSYGVYIDDCRDIWIGRFGTGNVIAGNGDHGIYATGSRVQDVRIRSSLIGVLPDGVTAHPNAGDGIHIDGAGTLLIGGIVTPNRNIISGNTGHGVALVNGSQGTELRGNLIGLSEDGTTSVPNGGDGVHIADSYDNTVGGNLADHLQVISGNGGAGVRMTGPDATGNLVQANYIGLDLAGGDDRPNEGGVILELGAHDNIVGTPGPETLNTISANNVAGILLTDLETTGNLIRGNRIGPSVTGMIVRAAFDGILCSGCGATTIGGTTSGAGNVISANANGITVEEGAVGVVIQGNFIGVSGNGTDRIKNYAHGIQLEGVTGILIGGDTPEARNIISGNDLDGIRFETDADENFISGNYIGVAADGTTAQPNLESGITLRFADRNLVGGTQPGEENVISGNGESGVHVENANLNQIFGNLIGLDVTGASAVPNGADGVLIDGNNNDVGDRTVDAGNVISGNIGHGVHVADAQSTDIFGNLIGLNAAGDGAVGNGGAGVYSAPGTINTNVGYNLAGSGNVISGNGSHGVHYEGVSRIGVLYAIIAQNIIGLDAEETAPIPNSGNGILLDQCSSISVGGERSSIFVGQDCAGNVISGNNGNGVLVLGGEAMRITRNIIGTNAALAGDFGNGGTGIQVEDGATDILIGADPILGVPEETNVVAYNATGIKLLDNATSAIEMRANTIFANDGDGIELLLGANGGINPPVITGLDPVTGTAAADSTIELFAASDDEGRRFIDTINVDSNGDFTKIVDLSAFGGLNLTATATDENDNTSAFSLPVAIPGTGGEGEGEGEGATEGEMDGCGDGLISGTVTDSVTGDPLDLANIRLTNADDELVGERNTTQEGYYLLSPVPVGDYTLTATKVGYLDYTDDIAIMSGLGTPGSFAMDPDPDFMPEGEEGDPTATLSVLVRDAVTDDPLEGAAVTLTNDGAYLDDGVTDATGMLDFGTVPAVRISFQAELAGYEMGRFDIRIFPDEDRTVVFELVMLAEGEGEGAEGEGAPEPGSLGGVVQDAGTTQPIAGALVTLSQGALDLDTATTDNAGVYNFLDLTPGTYDLRVEADGYEALVKSGTVPAGGFSNVNFSLTASGAEGEGEGEGAIEGEGEGIAPQPHSADTNNNGVIDFGEVLRVVQLYNAGGFQCDPGTIGPGEDGYLLGLGSTLCDPHSSDYQEQNWRIELSELLRLIQFYTREGFYACPGSEDGFCPGTAPSR